MNVGTIYQALVYVQGEVLSGGSSRPDDGAVSAPVEIRYFSSAFKPLEGFADFHPNSASTSKFVSVAPEEAIPYASTEFNVRYHTTVVKGFAWGVVVLAAQAASETIATVKAATNAIPRMLFLVQNQIGLSFTFLFPMQDFRMSCSAHRLLTFVL